MIESYVGRERELKLLHRAIEAKETIIVAGVSGVGKSSLAREALRRLNASGRTVREVSCFGESPRGVARAIARPDFEIELTTDELWALALEINPEDVLLLDDIGFEIGQLRQFLDNRRQATIITTNRHVDGNPVLTLRPFSVDDEKERAEARAIFNEAMKKTNLAAVEGEPAVVDTIVRRLSGHPISVALAGRRAATLGPEGILELLDDVTALMDPTRQDRHQTPLAAVRFTLENLDQDERRLLLKLARLGKPVPPSVLSSPSEHSGALFETLHRLVVRGVVHSGERVSPLELFSEAANDFLPEIDPTLVDEVDREIISEALRRAAVLPRGYRTFEFDHEDYIYWEAAHWRCKGHRDDERGVLLAAWLRGAFASRDVYADDFDWERVDQVLTEVDWPPAWLHAAAAASGPMLDSRTRRYLEKVFETDADDETLLGARTLKLGLGYEQTPVESHQRLMKLPREWLFDNPLALFVHGVVAQRAGALKTAREAFAAAAEHPAVSKIIEIRARVCWCALATDLDAADRQIGIILDQVTSLGPAVAKDAYHSAGFLLLRRGDYGQASERLAQGLDAVVAFNPRLANEARINYGFALVLNGKPEAALDQANQALTSTDWSRNRGGRRRASALKAMSRWQLEPDDLQRDWGTLRASLIEDEEKPELIVRCIDIDLLRDPVSMQMHVDAEPQLRPLFEVLLRGTTCAAREVVKVREDLREVQRLIDDDTLHPYVIGVIRFWLAERASPILRQMLAAESANGVTLIRDPGLLWVDKAWHPLDRVEIARKILEALIECDHPIDYEQLGKRLYGDEFVEPTALKNRIDVQLSKLRRAGLKPYLVKHAKGFVLDVAARTVTSTDEAHLP